MSKKGGYYCAFKNCRGLSRRDKRSFFRFPKDPQRSKQWVKACERSDLLEKTPIELFNSYRICAKHFTDSMFLNDLKNRLQPNSVPVHQESQEIYEDLIDIQTKKEEFPNFEDPITKILNNSILQKISAEEFFKATGICIHEPISTMKSKEYLQNLNSTDHIYSTTKANNTFITDENTSSFSIEAVTYQDLINSLPTSFINATNTESFIETYESLFMDSDKTVGINKLSKSILKGQDDISAMNNISNTDKTFNVMTQTTLNILKDKLEETIQSNYLENKLEKIIQTELNLIKNKLDESTQTESSFLRYKLNKKKLKNILPRKQKIKDLKSKIKQNYINSIDNITLEQYELLTEKFFPTEISDFIKLQAQLFKTI